MLVVLDLTELVVFLELHLHQGVSGSFQLLNKFFPLDLELPNIGFFLGRCAVKSGR